MLTFDTSYQSVGRVQNKMASRTFNFARRALLAPNTAFLARIISRNSTLKNVRCISTTQRLDSNEKFWSLGKLNHVAIAVPDLDKASNLYRNVFGAKVSDSQALPEHGVYTVFVNLGNTKIELLHPLGEKSPISGFLKNKPDGGIHHICIEVKNITEAMKDLKEHKIRALSSEPKIGAHGKPVVFLHPKDCGGVLVELEEE